MIKAIVFDLWGVTLTQRSLLSKYLYPLVSSFISKEELRKRYNAACVAALSEKEFWQGIPQPEKIKKKILAQISLNEEISFLEKLKEKYFLVLFSRTPQEWGQAVVEKFNLKHSYEKIFFTADLRLDKSNPQAFQKIQEELKLKPQEIIFIDDKPNNLAPAKKVGWKTVWLENQAYPLKDFQPDFVIKSLREIEKAVKAFNA